MPSSLWLSHEAPGHELGARSDVAQARALPKRSSLAKIWTRNLAHRLCTSSSAPATRFSPASSPVPTCAPGCVTRYVKPSCSARCISGNKCFHRALVQRLVGRSQVDQIRIVCQKNCNARLPTMRVKGINRLVRQLDDSPGIGTLRGLLPDGDMASAAIGLTCQICGLAVKELQRVHSECFSGQQGVMQPAGNG